MIGTLQYCRQRLAGSRVEPCLRWTGLGRAVLRGYEAVLLRRGQQRLNMFGHRFRFRVASRLEITHVDLQARTEAEYIGRLLDTLRPGDVVYDIGAHIGLVSSVVGRCGPAGVRVVAFEPEPANAGHLRENLRLNQVTNVTICEAAVGQVAGHCPLFIIEGEVGAGTHSVMASKDGQRRAIHVPMVSVNDFASQGNSKPDVVKIDVEGAEAEVLKGFGPLLGPGGVRDIFIELHHERLLQAGTDADQLRHWIESRGYLPVYIRPRGPETHCHFHRTE